MWCRFLPRPGGQGHACFPAGDRVAAKRNSRQCGKKGNLLFPALAPWSPAPGEGTGQPSPCGSCLQRRLLSAQMPAPGGDGGGLLSGEGEPRPGAAPEDTGLGSQGSWLSKRG